LVGVNLIIEVAAAHCSGCVRAGVPPEQPVWRIWQRQETGVQREAARLSIAATMVANLIWSLSRYSLPRQHR
jgi:hypothetical protein